ncbi:MAG: NUDIX hydrolase [Patescibacteria group bacterium]|jgi:8-oxo-dGTP pyrophosphatase MutT (NUDIX family)
MISSKKLENFNKKFDVVSLFVIVGNKILLLKRHDDKPQPGLWGPPAGKVDEGESLKQGMIRETFEESGVSIKNDELKHFKKEYFVRHGDVDFIFHVFAVYRDDFMEVNINGTEHIEYGWFDMQEALNMDLVEDEYIPLKDYFNL